MIKILRKITNNEFLRNSLILISAAMLMNFFGYLFHFYAGRTLGPVDYGIFGALSSLLYIIIVPLNTVQTTISKFVSNFKVSEEFGKIRYLLIKSNIKLLILGVIFGIFFMSFSYFIADFLHIESIFPLFLLMIFFVLSLLVSVNRGVLQGLQKFVSLGYNLVWEGASKLVTGVILLGIGLRVNGAMTAMIMSYFVPFMLSWISLKFLTKHAKVKFVTKSIYTYSIPVLLTMFFLTSIYSVDVLLVKHFLSAKEAGYYVAASLLAKIVYFASSSIVFVMFPQVNELFIRNLSHKKLLIRALVIVTLITGSITGFYFLFPEFTVKLLFGNEFLEISRYIGYFGLTMAIFSLIYVLSFYNLSINKTRFIYILAFFVLLEILLIYLFHESIIMIISIMLGLLSFLFLSLILYTILRK